MESVLRGRGRRDGLRDRGFSEGERDFLSFFFSLLIYGVETSSNCYGLIVIKHHVLLSQVETFWAASAAGRSRVAVQRSR